MSGTYFHLCRGFRYDYIIGSHLNVHLIPLLKAVGSVIASKGFVYMTDTVGARPVMAHLYRVIRMLLMFDNVLRSSRSGQEETNVSAFIFLIRFAIMLTQARGFYK